MTQKTLWITMLLFMGLVFTAPVHAFDLNGPPKNINPNAAINPKEVADHCKASHPAVPVEIENILPDPYCCAEGFAFVSDKRLSCLADNVNKLCAINALLASFYLSPPPACKYTPFSFTDADFENYIEGEIKQIQTLESNLKNRCLK